MNELIKSKADFVKFIERQFGARLENDASNPLNQKRYLLYTRLPKRYKNSMLAFFIKYGYQTNEHLNDYYFIYIRRA